MSEFVDENWTDTELIQVLVCLDCKGEIGNDKDICPHCGSIYLITETRELNV